MREVQADSCVSGSEAECKHVCLVQPACDCHAERQMTQLEWCHPADKEFWIPTYYRNNSQKPLFWNCKWSCFRTPPLFCSYLWTIPMVPKSFGPPFILCTSWAHKQLQQLVWEQRLPCNGCYLWLLQESFKKPLEPPLGGGMGASHAVQCSPWMHDMRLISVEGCWNSHMQSAQAFWKNIAMFFSVFLCMNVDRHMSSSAFRAGVLLKLPSLLVFSVLERWETLSNTPWHVHFRRTDKAQSPRERERERETLKADKPRTTGKLHLQNIFWRSRFLLP